MELTTHTRYLDALMLTFSAGSGPIRGLSYTSDSQALVVDCRDVRTQSALEVAWWDIATQGQIRHFRLRDSLYGPGGFQTSIGGEAQDYEPDQPPLSVSFCTNPMLIATVWEWTNKEDGVLVFDPDKLEVVAIWTPYKTHTQRAILSPDGKKLLASTWNDMDGSALLEVWNVEPDKEREASLQKAHQQVTPWEFNIRSRIAAERRSCRNPMQRITDHVFDGHYTVSCDAESRDLFVWDTQSIPPDEQLPDDFEGEMDLEGTKLEGSFLALEFAPQCLAISSPASLVAIGGTSIGLLDLQSQACRVYPRIGETITALAFSPDGKELLCGTEQGLVEHWEVESGVLLRTYKWFQGCVTALAWAPDGTTCSAGTFTGQLVVWDKEQG